MTARTSTHNPVGGAVAQHPGIVRVGRAGWLAKGIVYVVAGLLALLIISRSFGWTNAPTTASEASPTGAIKEVAASGGGKPLLYVLAIGMFLYAVWRIVAAALPGGTDVKAVATRIGYVVSAAIYGALGLTAISLAKSPAKSADGNQTVTDLTARVMTHTGGRFLIGIAGLAAIGAGLYHVAKGFKLDVTREVDMGGMTAERARWTRRVGAVGEVGRGLGIALIGFFLFRAAVTFNANEATGLDGVLRRLLVHSWGVILVALVGLGFLAYGLFCATTFNRQRLQAP